jgi:hypothetical protein
MSQPADEPIEPVEVPFEPNPSLPKTIGTLNIVFGSLLLFCSICSGLGILWQAAFFPMMQADLQQARARMEAQRQQDLDKLRQQAKDAETDEEKADIEKRAKQLAATPLPPLPDFTEFTPAKNPKLLVYTVTDAGTGIITDVAMIIAGIGLLRLQEWGRRLAIWVAAAKILFLVLGYVYYLLAVVPDMTKAMTKFFEGPMAGMMGIMMGASGLISVVVGVIYPIVTIAVLTRRGAIAACQTPRFLE